jgi:hypothetical protein
MQSENIIDMHNTNAGDLGMSIYGNSPEDRHFDIMQQKHNDDAGFEPEENYILNPGALREALLEVIASETAFSDKELRAMGLRMIAGESIPVGDALTGAVYEYFKRFIEELE